MGGNEDEDEDEGRCGQVMDFLDTVERIVRSGPDLVGKERAIERELLQYDILAGLHVAGLLRHLVFKGGTAIRLVYGGYRYSDDVDFSRRPWCEERTLDGLGDAVIDMIGTRYGLDVRVERRRLGGVALSMERWRVHVKTMRGARFSPVQTVPIDVAGDVVAEPGLARLRAHYAHLMPQAESFVVPTFTLGQIAAEKAVACPAAMLELKRERYRDIWDMWWLGRDAAIEVDADQITAAVGAENVAAYQSMAAEFTARLHEFVESGAFAATMRNLLNVRLFEQMIAAPEGRRDIEEGARRVLAKAVATVGG